VASATPGWVGIYLDTVSSPAPGLLGGGVVFLPHPACWAAAASRWRPHPARVLCGCRVCGGRRRPQQARVTAMGGRGRMKRPLIREDLNVIQSTSPRRLMPHLLHQIVQNRTNLGGHSIQIMIISSQATT
jgi:hypothetical protein